MTLHHLLSEPEFWAALFGALAAFILGALGTWWAASSSKRNAGNLTLVTLSQMYGLIENLRYQLFVEEPRRFFKIANRPPRSFEVRAAIGLPSKAPSVPFDQLGFLADSHDPDLMSRLLTVERAFASMLYMVHRHEQLHAELQTRLNALDPTGQRPIAPQELVARVGAKLFIEIDDALEDMRTKLPETRDALIAIGKQLHQILCIQFPLRRFVGFTPAPRSRTMDQQPSDLAAPATWRRMLRWSVDILRKRMRAPWAPVVKVPAAVPEPQSHEIKRFPPRSYDEAK